MFKLIAILALFFHLQKCQKYDVTSLEETDIGLKGTLSLTQNLYPDYKCIEKLNFEFFFETRNRLRFKVTDPEKKRWEVPEVVISETPEKKPSEVDFTVDVIKSPFSFSIKRKDDQSILFDTSDKDFYFCDQFIEMSTFIPKGVAIYGLGEHKETFRLKNNNKTYVLYNEDNGGTPLDKNLYGSHPFYLQHYKKRSHGVFLLNSNAQDFNIDEDKNNLRYRTIGGIIDMFIFTGDEPKDVVKQFLQVTGKPFMPAYWMLGNQQCRWGYASLNISKNIVNKFSEYEIPLEVFWNDLDYMDAARDFTNHPTLFPYDEYKAFIDELHSKHMKYVQIIDPGINNHTDYYPYSEGIKRDIFIKKPNGQVIENLLWPGYSVWPDYFNPEAEKYWNELLGDHLDKFPIDGIWIDMNEMSAFCNGECYPLGDENDVPPNPPYIPPNLDLNKQTLRVDGKTFIGDSLYNTHNIYSLKEAMINFNGYKEKTGKRPFILTRSTFSGSQRYAAHWLGDDSSTWLDLEYSIKTMLSFSLFGFQMTGADICGFMWETNEELCTRWYQIGSFSGFMRNHNNMLSIPQEPWSFGKTLLDSTKEVIKERYKLLPYIYTQMFLSHVEGETYYRPLLFEFFEDENVIDIDKQFMIGSSLLISPVLTRGETKVEAYFPDSIWYNYYEGEKINCRKSWCKIDTPIEKINVHVRGGSIIPRKIAAAMTTFETRHNSYSILVAPDDDGAAQGLLYLDDGESLDSIESQKYSYIEFTLKNSGKSYFLINNVVSNNYNKMNLLIQEISILGMEKPSSLIVNGKSYDDYDYSVENKVLRIFDLDFKVIDTFSIQIN